MKFWTGLVAGAALLFSAPAMAQITTDEDARDLKFEEVRIKGELLRPPGMIQIARPVVSFGSLLRYRADFTAELDRSAAHL